MSEWKKSHQTLVQCKKNEELHLKQQSFMKLQLFKCMTGQKHAEALLYQESKNDPSHSKEEKESSMSVKKESMTLPTELEHEKQV